MTKFLVLDVFSQTPYGGNQLAVIPDASKLAEAQFQKIAREFNYSETTFVFPPQDPSHTAKLRIFTPTMEVPFAGHPTIGTAIALASLGHGPEMVLELGVGPLSCHAENGAARFTTPVDLDLLGYPAPALIARALGLDEDRIDTTTHAPVMVSLGLPFTLTELTDRAALAAIVTDLTAIRDGAERYPATLDFAQFAYVRDKNTIHARMFAPLDNIPEDPATGSAAAALGAYLAQLEGRDLTLHLNQGDDMGRPSVISIQTQNGTVTVSGYAVKVMEGRLNAEP
ncbi:Trans-2,3-dihydro-3-hydroxyanthranilate isomerase [Thalassovita gelatinovora]|uniref:Trans-2,3-dihydro-3-hydroxyanthranilate isomerase n=1 Tax=Thalassovita gelatinovora TaxID=53501 RepID=A0A0P1FRQ2_THAGE|nr:PhzF family phenazine biosynthesis protein [Thalassovita gelatinovora]QIZ79396.1 PhzF family phenazine biosynthesis protein [Thalassovita gelatinovora]CUH62723.1 Trans-2,3-dihydro-3-hydroxyanthranilate isomerase [Thalassovita gelatinovora]SEQ09110.1 trans-2,3-dihydro-3-hydroxyanthranilate isomerase [Thalassovita gelatinovora]